MEERILIVGGAGYIGSHTNKYLNDNNYKTVILDDLSYGHKDAVKWGDFVKGDMADDVILDKIFTEYKIIAVFHFSAFIAVGESVEKPGMYYNNNVSKTISLLNAMVRNNVDNFVFSSTCAIMGNPKYLPIDESHPRNPINPYGWSKFMVEQILKDFKKAHNLNSVVLRYFNASGADPSGTIGEKHNPETHLIPLVLDAAIGRRDSISIFGTDYDTDDGTCVRDYIHVNDLAQAHLLSLEWMLKNKECNDFNLGNGTGFSVKQLIEVVKDVTGNDVEVVESGRREGDAGTLIGASDKAHSILGWKPKFDSLETIIETAWKWHQKMDFLEK
ncbi:MAG: UDP-glucose 4-epimerase GalE [Candidatus Cloacimonadota bacterium]|nr:MAG: UDP-glucose 4-epimerase GalE [Candidatus Cloacimonadota bacterium]